MAFDQATRNRLQRFVNDARKVLETEFGRQLQNEYGLDPNSGAVAPLEKLAHLPDAKKETARILRDILAHYLAGETGADSKDALERIVREQAFTVLNRIVALRMAEARGLLIESIDHGYQAKGFQLYARVMGNSLGETGDAYRCYLFSVFDELAQDLPGLFERYSPQGRLFPRENALLQLIELVNQAEISPLWSEDEAIGWIFQYFNSKEERKKMRNESAAPRNSRELAVRNQFFTPRYVVEFLVDNTLGRLWFNATGGETALRERCQYLMVKPDEKPATVLRLRDPRTLKLLDPACGSMHFGLYAFDLFTTIYQEAWVWEQQNGADSLDRSLAAEQELLPLCQLYPDEATFLRDIPRLIIERNIYGVDIDPRAAQIAALALWLRAQRAWHETGIKAVERPAIGRGNVVAAIAPPHEPELREQLKATLDRKDASLFEKTLQLLKNLPELGVLLRVEQELPALIRQVYGETGGLFEESDAERWKKAEVRLREALVGYAQAAKSTYQNRLFAQDAMEVLRMIDLIREKFDVVVMNPPFGALSNGGKAYLSGTYPNSKNDLLGIFIDRGLDLLRMGGRLGAITSRTCFFLTRFSDWRKNVVLDRSGVDVIADLGQGVMDDAMVEAAAYILERGNDLQTTRVIRAIAEEDRHSALNVSIESYRQGIPDSRLFSVEPKTFARLPDSPFVYWVEDCTLYKLTAEKHFEPDIGSVRQGLSTGEDPRFVRTVWEVAPEDTQFCYFPANGESYCRLDDPIVQAYYRRRTVGTPRWAFHVKAGASQPWYSPITLKVNFGRDGAELRSFKNASGKQRSVVPSVSLYYRPGFSWTRRAVRFYPYVIPGNCIPSGSRYMAFPELGRQFEALGVCASRLVSVFLRFYAEFWQRPNFLVENVKMLPWPTIHEGVQKYFSTWITREVAQRRQAYQNFEPFHEFTVPAKVKDFSQNGKALEFNPVSLIGEEGERLVAEAFGLSPMQANAIEKDLMEALEYQGRRNNAEESEQEEIEDVDSDFVLDTSPYATEEANVSYFLGCSFGRWDIRLATGERELDALGDPFAPLPVCPPGMLQNSNGLPIKESELPCDYPMAVAWTGILVDDTGHRADIIEHIREGWHLVWGEQANAEEEKTCAILGVKVLREYFRRPTGFFAEHLKRYSKSRRQAPIYWPLSTPSNSYTLWIYYSRLTDQTLFIAVNDFLEPKLKQVGGELVNLRVKGSKRCFADEKQYEKLQAFEQELMELRDTLLKIAPHYHPNQDDGVQITAAPLWPLFRHKPWQKVLKETWAKLEKGDYDWANLAMQYWPERVRAKCKTDKSLAIAHGMEDLYVEPVATTKKKAKK